ncbi:hypothetical protein F5Y16DRAFT_383544 [Xylariaceae sp. FL0255]|nr:hypothetical protein F5Y16DRAFT_383544 [Xylariaceae sp. FL0255]
MADKAGKADTVANTGTKAKEVWTFENQLKFLFVIMSATNPELSVQGWVTIAEKANAVLGENRNVKTYQNQWFRMRNQFLEDAPAGFVEVGTPMKTQGRKGGNKRKKDEATSQPADGGLHDTGADADVESTPGKKRKPNVKKNLTANHATAATNEDGSGEDVGVA